MHNFQVARLQTALLAEELFSLCEVLLPLWDGSSALSLAARQGIAMVMASAVVALNMIV